MYCIEESPFHIVGTYPRPPQWFGAPGIVPSRYAPGDSSS